MIELLIPLILFLFPLAYSPGPGNLFFAANGARYGFMSTLGCNLGYHVATLLVTIFIGLSFGALTGFSSQILYALKLIGSLYVLYLAYKLATAGTSKQAVSASKAGFVDGALLLLLNPKAYVIILLMFSQFLDAQSADKTQLVAVIAVAFTLNNCVAFSMWTLIGDKLGKLLAKDVNAKKQNIFFGLMLAAVGVWMLFS